MENENYSRMFLYFVCFQWVKKCRDAKPCTSTKTEIVFYSFTTLSVNTFPPSKGSRNADSDEQSGNNIHKLSATHHCVVDYIQAVWIRQGAWFPHYGSNKPNVDAYRLSQMAYL